MDRIGRRTFLASSLRALFEGGSLALVGAAAACSSESGQPGRVPPQTTSPRPPTTAPDTLEDLGRILDGTLVRRGQRGYGSAKLVYDLRYAGSDPVAIAYCATPSDVARCIEFARNAGFAPIPRCGGHSYGGYSTGTGLVIDVTRMNGATFSSSKSRAFVGAGTLLVDLYAACASAGALIPGGSCPTVGIAGLTLGGGIGVVARRYGLTCDNLESVEIVTADGRILTCSERSHPDLFWACRGGGGGNFGIATAFGFRTRPIPELALYTCDWEWPRAAQVLSAWQGWMSDAPEELWSNCQLLYQGVDGPLVRSSGVLVGNSSRLLALVDALTGRAGEPSYRVIGSDSYLDTMLVEAGCDGLSVAECHLSGQTPAAQLARTTFTAKSAYVRTIMPPAGVDAAVGVISSLQQAGADVGAGLVFDASGGAINAVASDATAFVHRDALFAVELSSTVEAESEWLRSAAGAIAPYCDGEAYQNYIDPSLANWEQAYYGANLRRLSSVKRAYDPDDVFHFAQSIPLSRVD